MASVQIAGGQPILNHTFTLTCETAGSVKSIIWMYNWSPLSGDDTRILSMDNATLTFSPIVQMDNGHYHCVAFNPVSILASEIFTLEFFCEFYMLFIFIYKISHKSYGAIHYISKVRFFRDWCLHPKHPLKAGISGRKIRGIWTTPSSQFSCLLHQH